MKYLWKSMNAGLKSNYDKSSWEIGQWRKEKVPTEECVGLNASPRIIDAMFYVNMEILARVEVGGKIIKGADKWTCQNIRVVEAYIWPKEENVRMAIFAAELVIDIYEKEYPDDDRPRKAIEAAKKWLESPSEAASEASEAARAASEAARAASEAWAAWAASEAARAAWAAARAARAARAAILDKIEAYLLGRIEHLEKYEASK